VQAVQDHILNPDNPALPEREMLASQRYFSSLPDTMLSLFMCIAGGASWEDVQAPLKAISTVWVFFFLFFVSFTYFAAPCLQKASVSLSFFIYFDYFASNPMSFDWKSKTIQRSQQQPSIGQHLVA